MRVLWFRALCISDLSEFVVFFLFVFILIYGVFLALLVESRGCFLFFYTFFSCYNPWMCSVLSRLSKLGACFFG